MLPEDSLIYTLLLSHFLEKKEKNIIFLKVFLTNIIIVLLLLS